MYDDILVPTDGSEGVEEALEHARSIAGKYDATVHVLYVVNTSTYSSLPADSNWESIVSALEEEGERSTSELAQRLEDDGIEVEREVRDGVPHKEILEYSDEEDIDLVVMGTHGKTGIDRLLLGSVTEKVVRKSEAPVLTVRMVEE